VNRWLLGAARSCRNRGLSEIQTEARLRDETRNCGRVVQTTEFTRAIRRAFSSQFTSTTTTAQKWPTVCQTARHTITSKAGLADLWEASPVRWEDETEHNDQIIDALFPGNPLLTVGLTSYDFDTCTREEWRGLMHNRQFIVPSPCFARKGLTKDGKLSAHCESIVGPRRFIVCEFDQGSHDEHAALLLHLANFAPLVLCVHSGSKSLHGWFYVADRTEESSRTFFNYAVSLGADSALWSKAQWCRIPDGTRDSGKRQTVYFFNPKPAEDSNE
jgi:hypothetical protein